MLPNVSLRDEDEEVFNMNSLEFIHRDMEGSDVNTRRRRACELLRVLSMNHTSQVTDIIFLEINGRYLAFIRFLHTHWKDMVCAIYLAVSVGASGSTDLIDVPSYFANSILEELTSLVNSFPMLKAVSLRFLTNFLSHMPSPLQLSFFLIWSGY